MNVSWVCLAKQETKQRRTHTSKLFNELACGNQSLRFSSWRRMTVYKLIPRLHQALPLWMEILLLKWHQKCAKCEVCLWKKWKSVCVKILNREETLKLLKSKFSVTGRHLTTLTPSQLLEVAAKKHVANIVWSQRALIPISWQPLW